MSKIAIIIPEPNHDLKAGIDIRVNDPQATVADLLEAWQPLCDDPRVIKQYGGENGMCRGCVNNCCNTAYVIPDLIAFKKMAAALALDHQDFIDEYFDVEKTKAGLLRMRPNPCIFLRDNICTIYSHRSLICRFYLCSNMSGDCEQLVYSIAWAGSAALQVYAEKNQMILPVTESALGSFDLMFKRLIEEYRLTPWVKLFLEAEDYDDIPLQSFLPWGNFTEIAGF